MRWGTVEGIYAILGRILQRVPETNFCEIYGVSERFFSKTVRYIGTRFSIIVRMMIRSIGIRQM